MSYDLDFAWIGINNECAQKPQSVDHFGTESGIESASSSSSLEELSKQSAVMNKAIVTGAAYIAPQTSNSRDIPLPARPSAVELVVIYRGKADLPYPVPMDRGMRTKAMKACAKTLQSTDHCRFVLMRIEEEWIKFLPLEGPRTVLYEIPCHQLDLVKQSRKDICFFYFTTDTTGKVGTTEALLSSAGGQGTLSGYTCYVFHGNCPRTADRAHRLIKHFVDLKAKAQIYSLNPLQLQQTTYLQPVSSTVEPAIEAKPCAAQSNLQNEALPVVETTTSQETSKQASSALDLLLNIDDFSASNDNSALSMFDELSLSTPDTTETKKNSDLLGEILAPPPPPTNGQGNLFANRHHTYSAQMAGLLGPTSAPVPPAAAPPVGPLQVNYFYPNLTPSQPPSAQVLPMNPFAVPQQMAPAPPKMPAPLVPSKPVANPFSSTHTLNCQSTNPFGSSSSLLVQYPSSSSNPFSSISQEPASQPSFASDFDDFLSDAVKNQFKK